MSSQAKKEREIKKIGGRERGKKKALGANDLLLRNKVYVYLSWVNLLTRRSRHIMQLIFWTTCQKKLGKRNMYKSMDKWMYLIILLTFRY